MRNCHYSEFIEAIRDAEETEIEYATMHCFNGSSFEILNHQLYQNSHTIVNHPDFLFLAINLANGDLKIICKNEENK